MSPDETDETRESPEAETMQRQVDELGEHIDEAVKKAEVTREQARPGEDDTLKDVAGEWAGVARDEDDPSGAVDEHADAEQ